MRVLVWVVVIALSGCFTTIGAIVGGRSAPRYPVEYAPPRPIVRVAPIPTDEEKAECEQRRTELSAQAATTGDPQARATLLASMPNCRDVYALTHTPPPLPVTPTPPEPIRWERRTDDIVTRSVEGGLIGALLDAGFVLLIASGSR